MRYDRVANLFENTRISDGMGGFIEESVVSESFSIHLTQLPQELLLLSYGYDAKRDFRVFSLRPLPVGSTFEVDGHTYKVNRSLETGRRCTMVVSRL